MLIHKGTSLTFALVLSQLPFITCEIGWNTPSSAVTAVDPTQAQTPPGLVTWTTKDASVVMSGTKGDYLFIVSTIADTSLTAAYSIEYSLTQTTYFTMGWQGAQPRFVVVMSVTTLTTRTVASAESTTTTPAVFGDPVSTPTPPPQASPTNQQSGPSSSPAVVLVPLIGGIVLLFLVLAAVSSYVTKRKEKKQGQNKTEEHSVQEYYAPDSKQVEVTKDQHVSTTQDPPASDQQRPAELSTSSNAWELQERNRESAE